jgi:hypothetical protein
LIFWCLKFLTFYLTLFIYLGLLEFMKSAIKEIIDFYYHKKFYNCTKPALRRISNCLMQENPILYQACKLALMSFKESEYVKKQFKNDPIVNFQL